MITYVKGDIFSSPAKILVNTVNTVGVMGKGVALEFKKRYPEMFQTYQQICREEKLTIGKLYLWKESEKWIMLFPTKKHWRYPSKLEFVEQGLQTFVNNWDKFGADSIAFPRLGCGNGGLDWALVQPLMEKYLKNLPMQIYVYVDNYNDPFPEHENISEMEKWLSGERDLEGYEKFRQALKNYLQKNNKGVLHGQQICAGKEESVLLTIGETELSEEQICEMWNLVKDVGVISAEEFPCEYQNVALPFLKMMREMRWAKNIYASHDGTFFTSEPNAFQYVEN